MIRHVFGALAVAVVLAQPAGASPRVPGTLAVKPACGRASASCYTSIALALEAAARDTSGRWITIRVAPGDYREKPNITRDRIRLVGSGAGRTRLHFDAVAQTAKAYHRAGWGTPGSATLTIDAKDVVVSGLTVENDYDYLANDRLADGDPGKIGNPQAVALLLDIHSDRVRLEHVGLLGYQDTLFANGGRALIRSSLIAGNIDFIFGNGQLLIEDSEIRSRRRSAPYLAGEFQSFIAAPSTQLSQQHGIIFYRSRLTREQGVPDGAVALARPWHPTTSFADGRYADPKAVGQVSFIDCVMGSHIHPDHWTVMNGTARAGTMTDVFRPQDSRFMEAGSRGPGAVARDIGMSWKGQRDIRRIKADFFLKWRL
ncbi:pectinesterase family protein [Sphingomonas sp. KR3-1]|uniref:pectinesterase family protein n=1 Tax=Sphingomonas sp. KR3-1 TaxID=3156611 RepID=UPI0032B34E1C